MNEIEKEVASEDLANTPVEVNSVEPPLPEEQPPAVEFDEPEPAVEPTEVEGKSPLGDLATPETDLEVEESPPESPNVNIVKLDSTGEVVQGSATAPTPGGMPLVAPTKEDFGLRLKQWFASVWNRMTGEEKRATDQLHADLHAQRAELVGETNAIHAGNIGGLESLERQAAAAALKMKDKYF